MNSKNLLGNIDKLCEAAMSEEAGDFSFDLFKKAGIADNREMSTTMNIPVTSLDNEGHELKIGDVVDCLTDDSKKHGIVVNIGRYITIEWEDGDNTLESASNLVVLDADQIEDLYDEEQPEEPDTDDEPEDEEEPENTFKADRFSVRTGDEENENRITESDRQVFDDGENLLSEQMHYPGF